MRHGGASGLCGAALRLIRPARLEDHLITDPDAVGSQRAGGQLDDTLGTPDG